MRHRIGLHLADPKDAPAAAKKGSRTAPKAETAGAAALTDGASDDGAPEEPTRRPSRRRPPARPDAAQAAALAAGRHPRGGEQQRRGAGAGRGGARGPEVASEEQEAAPAPEALEAPEAEEAPEAREAPEAQDAPEADEAPQPQEAPEERAPVEASATGTTRRRPPPKGPSRPARPASATRSKKKKKTGSDRARRATRPLPARAPMPSRARSTPWCAAWGSRRPWSWQQGEDESDLAGARGGRRHRRARRARAGRPSTRCSTCSSQIASRAEGGSRRRVSLDADGYRARRAAALEDLADRAAREAVEYGEEIELDPMTPHDRRIVHMALKDRTGGRHPQRGRRAPPPDHRRARRVATGTWACRAPPIGFT